MEERTHTVGEVDHEIIDKDISNLDLVIKPTE